MKICSFVLAFLLCATAYAEKGIEIVVFTNNSTTVDFDTDIDSVIVFNLDAKDAINDTLTNKIHERVKKNHPGEVTNMTEVYREEFQEFMATSEWSGIQEAYRVAGSGLAKAAKLNVEKIPAIVFNNQHVIYGVTSLKEAINIYKGSL